MSTEVRQFAFHPSPSLDEFRTLCQEQLQKARALFETLEKPVETSDVERYGHLLDDFDRIDRNAFELQGRTWDKFHPNPKMREASRTANKAYTELVAAVLSSSAIMNNILKLEKAGEIVDAKAARLMGSWKQDLAREGAFLLPEAKERVRRLTAAIKAKANEFTEHIWDDNDKLSLKLSELKGVPEAFVSGFRVDKITGEIQVSRKKADVNPILTFCDIQSTREKVYRHQYNTASPSNKDVLESLLSLRREKAILLGYDNWATYEMKRTMIQSPEQASALLADLRSILIGPAREELTKMEELAASRGIETFKIWDVAYGQQLLKQEADLKMKSRHSLQSLSVNKVLPSLMSTVGSMFGVRFHQVDGLTTWHSDVKTFDVYEQAGSSERLIGRVFIDLYARQGKCAGLITATVRKAIKGKQLGGVIISTSLSATPETPMTFDDAREIFKAFGGCVNILLARQPFSRMAGLDSIEADFAGVSSQLLHNFFNHPKCLNSAIAENDASFSQELLASLIATGDIGKAMIRLDSLVAGEMSVSTDGGRGRCWLF